MPGTLEIAFPSFYISIFFWASMPPDPPRQGGQRPPKYSQLPAIIWPDAYFKSYRKPWFKGTRLVIASPATVNKGSVLMFILKELWTKELGEPEVKNFLNIYCHTLIIFTIHKHFINCNSKTTHSTDSTTLTYTTLQLHAYKCLFSYILQNLHYSQYSSKNIV